MAGTAQKTEWGSKRFAVVSYTRQPQILEQNTNRNGQSDGYCYSHVSQ